MIRFLKDCECGVKTYWECGGGCCSGYEDDGTDFFKAGEDECRSILIGLVADMIDSIKAFEKRLRDDLTD